MSTRSPSPRPASIPEIHYIFASSDTQALDEREDQGARVSGKQDTHTYLGELSLRPFPAYTFSA